MSASLTDQVKEELSAVSVPRQSARAAEAAAILRFAGELQLHGEQVSYDVELASKRVADRLVATLDDLYGITATTHLAGPGASAKKNRIQVRITDGAKELTRRLGLVTRSGHPVVGRPPQVISGSVADNEAAWRGAFLAQGSLTEPGRSSALEVTCPCQEAAPLGRVRQDEGNPRRRPRGGARWRGYRGAIDPHGCPRNALDMGEEAHC